MSAAAPRPLSSNRASALALDTCLVTLEASPDIDWPSLSSLYRKRVQSWHPDRYTGSSPTANQERYVALTQAYKTVRLYHRRHGRLPPRLNGPTLGVDAGLLGRKQVASPRRGGRNDSAANYLGARRQPNALRVLSPIVVPFTIASTIVLSICGITWHLEQRQAQSIQERAQQHSAMRQEDTAP